MKYAPVDRDNFIHALVSKVKELSQELNGETPTRTQFTESGASDYQIRLAGGYEKILQMAGLESKKPKKKLEEVEEEFYVPKILIFDIELAPIMAYVWGLFDQNIGLNQIVQDWYVLSWAAKWLGTPEAEVMYADQRDVEDLSNDYGIISQIWQLLDEADIVITQNGIRFDVKKLNARFLHHGFPAPSSFRHIDTLRIAKKNFGLTSNKLEYMTDKFCVKYKKLKHKDFQGMELWVECMKGNLAAFNSMEQYNRYDVLSLEELYLKMRRWDRTINFNVYHDGLTSICSCGSKNLLHSGYDYTNAARRERFICQDCGHELISKKNVLSKEKKKSLLH